MRRFAYKLALRLGYVNVEAMLRSITSEQFVEWIEYDKLDPFGQWREDYRSAEIVTMLANVNRDAKRKREPFKTTDFLVKFGEQINDKPKQSWQDQLNIAKLFASAYNTISEKTL